MSATPNTNAAAYCTGAQFIVFYDERAIGDRLSDAGQTIPVGSVATHPTTLAILSAAAGDIERACFKSGKYNPAQLLALQNGGGNGAQSLAQLNADLAWYRILIRRPYSREEIPLQCVQALKDLDQLSVGVWIFGLLEQATAGKEIEVWSPAGRVLAPYTPLTQTYGWSRLYAFVNRFGRVY
jgi:hypothetical protein